MYFSPNTSEPGLPPSPMVEILDSSGSMPAGHYYFSLLQKYRYPRSGFGILKDGTISNTTGILAMGPSTHIRVDTPWNTVRISDIPIDYEREFASIFMSTDNKTFHQLAVAPAIENTFFYDRSQLTAVRGDRQESGLYRVTIINPAERYHTNVGTVITRPEVFKKPFELTTIDFQNTFPVQAGAGDYEHGKLNRQPPFEPYQIKSSLPTYPYRYKNFNKNYGFTPTNPSNVPSYTYSMVNPQ